MPNVRNDYREVLLTVVQEMRAADPGGGSLQSADALGKAAQKLGINSRETERAAFLLDTWNDLFSTGVLGWGLNLANPGPPYFHLRDTGRRALEQLSRDPMNPAGYLRSLEVATEVNALASSYLEEALECYVSGNFRAAAVMLGVANEALVLQLQAVVSLVFVQLQMPVPKQLKPGAQAKTVADKVGAILSERKDKMPYSLRVEFEAKWLAFSQEIRSARNDAGHPVSLEPVTPDAVHASFLAFPLLAKVAHDLHLWIADEMPKTLL